MGAVAIEKHFKLDESECGPDSSFSITPNQLSKLIEDCNKAWLARGHDGFFRADVESKNTIFRRSLYFINGIAKGQSVKDSDIRRIRPGYGIRPKHLRDVLGKKLTKNVERGDPVTWDCFEK